MESWHQQDIITRTDTRIRDLSDNSIRGSVLATFIHAASQAAPPTPLESWTSEVCHPDVAPALSAAGNAWKLHNDMRVMSQYARVLRDACTQNFFLNADPATCVEGLEWFHNFAQTVVPLEGDELQTVTDFLSACMLRNSTKTQGEAAFDAHRSIAKPDRNLTQFLIEHHFPGSHKQYELDVCAYMLARPDLTYNEWQAIFPAWRRLGLYYPLALASVYMSHVQCWLPAEAHDTQVANSLAHCLQSMRSPGADHTEPINQLMRDWNEDDTGASDVISGKLDRLAILMGIKSNGKPFELSRALAKFSKEFPVAELGSPADVMHRQNYLAWQKFKSAVESTFPPSLLSAPLVRPKRETWGYSRLTLSVQTGDPTPVVSFSQYGLEHVKPSETASNMAHTYHPPFVKDCMLHQTSQRIQDALWRLGEITTSPDISACMMRPDLALALLDQSPSESIAARMAPQHSVPSVLEKMSGRAESQDMALCYASYTACLDASIPQPTSHSLPAERALLMWRLDVPPRAILYMGSGLDVDPYAQSGHHLDKVLVNCKVPHKNIGGIVRVPRSSMEESLRAAIASFAKDKLSTHAGNTVLLDISEPTPGSGAKKRVIPATCTTLAESVACFALTRPESLTNCVAGSSSAWQEDGIDPRYAERQLADNGFRYRDWTAMHVGKHGTQQSRIASHLIRYDTLHTTVIPWFLSANDTRWVQISSSLPVEPKTIHGKTLRQAVEARFVHDLRMLPTENNGKTSRSNCEIYTDDNGVVGVAYCPEDSHVFHFMCFECRE